MDAFLLDLFLYMVCNPNNNAANPNMTMFSSIGKGGPGGPNGVGAGGAANPLMLKRITTIVLRGLFEKIFIFLV
jgi:hypothetical protein